MLKLENEDPSNHVLISADDKNSAICHDLCAHMQPVLEVHRRLPQELHNSSLALYVSHC
eukprot:m.35383 g.35383  ORF g.35383 m.35383 type:complete len:59 (+) comp14413_c0_seq2:665-841(+)